MSDARRIDSSVTPTVAPSHPQHVQFARQENCVHVQQFQNELDDFARTDQQHELEKKERGSTMLSSRLRKDLWPAVMIAGASLILVCAYLGAKLLAPTNNGVAQQIEYQLDLRDRNAGTGTPTLSAREGDRVTLRVVSAEPGELMIHGINKSARLVPGQESTLSFTAERSGRYFVHIHGSSESHKEAAVIEVAPR